MMRTSLLGITGVLTMMFLVDASHAVQTRRKWSRDDFAKAMATIDVAMHQEDVRRILGPPDDVRTRKDSGAIVTVDTTEIWGYGASRHLAFPTLGQIYFDSDLTVQYVFGGNGEPFGELAMIREDRLRALLQAIDEAPAINGEQYNPLAVIRIVNTLQPLGKDVALGVIDEYLRVAPEWNCDAREGLFLVLRVLFDVPDPPGHMPPMLLGAEVPPAPSDALRTFPRFPIVLRADIPLLLVQGYDLGSEPEQVEVHVDYFRTCGEIRTTLLRPSIKVLSVLDTIRHSPEWTGVSGQSEVLLMRQLLMLIESVYKPDDKTRWKVLGQRELKVLWPKFVQEFGELSILWDPDRKNYVLR